jgi:hypothetical protein
MNEWSPQWNDIDRAKPKNSEKNLSHHKSHWIDLGANPGRRGERPATNRLSHGTAKIKLKIGLSVLELFHAYGQTYGLTAEF